MWLPTPTDADVKSFQALVRRELQLELDYQQAFASATRLLQLYFFQLYGCSYLRKKVDRE